MSLPIIRPSLGGEPLDSADHQTLIGGEPARKRVHSSQLLAEDRDPLRIATRVGNRARLGTGPVERCGGLERSLHRAAPRQRPAAVVHAREKALLERAREVDAAREGAVASARKELQGRLAEAVLEILPAQAVTVHPQQQLALGERDERDLVRRVGVASCAPAPRIGAADSSFGLPSGRHMRMSPAAVRAVAKGFAVAPAVRIGRTLQTRMPRA